MKEDTKQTMQQEKLPAKRLKIAVLFGGRSSEHAVSLQSAAAVLRAMQGGRYEAVPVGITREGRWLWFHGSAEEIAAGAWESGACTPVALSPDPADHGLIVWEQSGAPRTARPDAACSVQHGRAGVPRTMRLDAAFPVLHGKNGEDGTVQGLLELAGIPCVGCGVLASAVCMDKDIAHRLARAAGVEAPPGVVLSAEEIYAVAPLGAKTAADGCEAGFSVAAAHTKLPAGYLPGTGCAAPSAKPEISTAIPSGAECGPSTAETGVFPSAAERPTAFTETAAVQERLAARTKDLRYPLFVKPARAGSSFGVTRVETPDKLPEAVAAALLHDGKILIEQGVPGFEVGCAVLGTGAALTVGEVDEIELRQGFFDYTEKYTLETARIHMPARLPRAERDRIRAAAKTVYRALDCAGFARVDLFYTPGGNIVFNEVNTIPGFTEHSRFPGMMRSVGLEFGALVERLVEGTVTAACVKP